MPAYESVHACDVGNVGDAQQTAAFKAVAHLGPRVDAAGFALFDLRVQSGNQSPNPYPRDLVRRKECSDPERGYRRRRNRGEIVHSLIKDDAYLLFAVTGATTHGVLAAECLAELRNSELTKVVQQLDNGRSTRQAEEDCSLFYRQGESVELGHQFARRLLLCN